MITGPITEEESRIVIELYRAGASAAEIARRCDRSQNTVQKWTRALSMGRGLGAQGRITHDQRAHIRAMIAAGVVQSDIASRLGVTSDDVRTVRRRMRRERERDERRATGEIRRVVRPRVRGSLADAEAEACRLAAWFRELTGGWSRGRPAGWWWA